MAGVDLPVKLTDQVSAPAKRAAKAVEGIGRAAQTSKKDFDALARAMRKISKAADKAKQATKASESSAAKFNKSRTKHANSSAKEMMRSVGYQRASATATGGMGSALGSMALRASAAAKAIDLIVAAIRAAAAAMVKFVGATIKMAAWVEKTRMGFHFVAGGVKKGNAAMSRAIKLSKTYGLDVMETTDQFKKLLAMQFSLSEATDVVKMAADMKALGMGAEATQRIIVAMTQIKSAGKLAGGEMKQLAEAGISTDLIYGALAKQLNKSVEQVKKMQAAGKITANQGLDAIKAAVKQKLHIDNLGDAGKKATKTLAGMWGKMKAAGQGAFIEFAQKVLPSIRKALVPIVEEIMAWSKSEGAKNLMNDIAAGFAAAAAAAASMWPHVKMGMQAMANMAVVIVGLTNKLNEWSAALGGAGDFSMIGAAIKGFVMIGVAIGTVLAAIFALAYIIMLPFEILKDATITALAPLANMGEAFSSLGQSIGSAFSSAWASLKAFGASFMALGSSMMAGLVEGIKAAAGAVVSAITGVVGAGIDAAKGALGISSPSKVFENMGAMSALGYEEGFADVGASIPAMSAGAVAPSFGGGGGANVTQNNSNTFNVTEAQSAEDTARMVKRMQLMEMASAFEQMAVEIGG